MQELRYVLIVVGALAIAGLLFHGLWASKKEAKAKFSNKPLGKIEQDEPRLKKKKSKRFSKKRAAKQDLAQPETAEYAEETGRDDAFAQNFAHDPLIDELPVQTDADQSTSEASLFAPNEDRLTDHFATPADDAMSVAEPLTPEPFASEIEVTDAVITQPITIEPMTVEPMTIATAEPMTTIDMTTKDIPSSIALNQPEAQAFDANITATEHANTDHNPPTAEEVEEQVFVLHVHTANNNQPFIGTDLFKSMQEHGLVYGEMDIFHYHTDMSGTGRVLFSVANMMNPGTLAHTDPAEFSTLGIAFFMMLPCYGNAEHNFKLMLQTAQQIADDLGGHVLDHQREYLTPNRITQYRHQILEFGTASV